MIQNKYIEDLQSLILYLVKVRKYVSYINNQVPQLNLYLERNQSLGKRREVKMVIF